MIHHIGFISLTRHFYGDNSGIGESFGKSGQPPAEVAVHRRGENHSCFNNLESVKETLGSIQKVFQHASRILNVTKSTIMGLVWSGVDAESH